jgi:capsular polysaccharide export protein
MSAFQESTTAPLSNARARFSGPDVLEPVPKTLGQDPDSPDAKARRNFLIVSAPFGPFARELAVALRSRGARCDRVLLNAGDVLDWGLTQAVPYFGGAKGWGDWLRGIIQKQAVTDLITYGDSSVYAGEAIAVGKCLGLTIHVLEQGYFRPDWITLERDGVNANSRLPHDAAWYLARAKETTETGDQVVGRAMPSAVFWIVRYHVAAYLGLPVFAGFRFGYRRSPILQALGHSVRYVFRRWLVHGHEGRLRQMMAAEGPLFLALLQRPGDSQLWRHSAFESTADFLRHIVSSFAAYAPADAHLMVRPHPLDPGLDSHERVLRQIAMEAGVEARVAFVDGGVLHEILPKIAGAVCVNSTAGLAAIEFERPTIVLGRAIYDIPGLTHQGGLDRFWTTPETPATNLYLAFRKVVLAATQVNGAFATPRGRYLAVPTVARRLMALECEDIRPMSDIRAQELRVRHN